MAIQDNTTWGNSQLRIDGADQALITRLGFLVGAENVTLESNGNVLVPHSIKVTQFLRTKNIHVPSPMLIDYNFPTRDPNKPAFQIQKTTCAMLSVDKRGYVLNELGTGKTRCVLWTYDYLKKVGVAQKLIVICPMSALYRTWGREIMREFHWLKFAILHGVKAKRLSELKKNVDIYIINHDGVDVIIDELIDRTDINMVCVDELAAYRNGGATRTKTLKEYLVGRLYAWGLTGSPCPREVTDVWAQCSCITPGTVPSYFTHFRAQLMYKVTDFRWHPKPGAEKRAVSCMQPSVRFKLNDVTELPPRVMSYYEAKLTKSQQHIYEEMRKAAVVLIKEHRVDALNAGAVLSKLLQIALGYVYTRDGAVVTLDNTPRLQMILDLIDASERKVLIFAPFKSAIAGISAMLTKNKVDHGIITGEVPLKQRNHIFGEFQDTPRLKGILAHPRTMAHSLQLTAATTTIWCGPVTSLEIFHQANGRTYRVGQNRKTLVAMVGGTPAEKKLYHLLASNEKVQNRFLEIMEQVTEEREDT